MPRQPREWEDLRMAMRIVGLGGSLRAASRSRAALEVALEGAAAAGGSRTIPRFIAPPSVRTPPNA